MKTFFTCTLLLFTTVTGFSQYASYGVSLGLGHSWMSNTGQQLVYNPSFNAGICMQYSSAENSGFGAEIRYTSEGYEFVYDPSRFTRVVSEYVRFHPKYIYFWNHAYSYIRPKFTIGPSIALMTGGRTRLQDAFGTTYHVRTNEGYKSFDAGVQGSFGVDFRLSGDTWLITDFSYYNGLIGLNKKGDRNQKNRFAVLNVGITFDL